jgi:hypothetical protein
LYSTKAPWYAKGEYLSGYSIGLRGNGAEDLSPPWPQANSEKTACQFWEGSNTMAGGTKGETIAVLISTNWVRVRDSSRKDIGLADERGPQSQWRLFVELSRLFLLDDWTVVHDGDPCGHRQSVLDWPSIGRRRATNTSRTTSSRLVVSQGKSSYKNELAGSAS